MDIGYTGAFLGGIISLLSPCSIMLLPAFFSYAFVSPGKLLARTMVFYFGLISTLIPLGIFSASLGSLLTENRSLLVQVAAIVLTLIALIQLSGIPIPGLTLKDNAETVDRTSAISVYFLGLVYAVAGVCTGPILGSVLLVAAVGSEALYGAFMLAFYGLGMVIPLIILALIWSKLGTRGRKLLVPKMVKIGRWQNSLIMIISGTLTLGLAVLLYFSDGTSLLPGIFSVNTQFEAESWVSRVGSTIPNGVFMAVAVIVLAGIALMLWLRKKRAKNFVMTVRENTQT